MSCDERACPYDPLVNLDGFDPSATTCEGTLAGATCPVRCLAGYGPNGVATCRRGHYDRDRVCRPTNAEPLEWLDELNAAIADGSFRTDLAAIMQADASGLSEPLFVQSNVEVAWHPDAIEVSIYVAGVAHTDVLGSEVRDALVSVTYADVTTRIVSDQVVSVQISEVPSLDATFDSFHSPYVSGVELRALVEFPPNPCVHVDDRDFVDELGHGCEWWAGRDCSQAESAHGLSDGSSMRTACACACASFTDWRQPRCVDAFADAAAIVAMESDGLGAFPESSSISALIDDDASTDYVLRVSRLRGASTFAEPKVRFNLTTSSLPFALNRYVVVSNSLSEDYDPLSWVLEGSDDALTWSTLHAVGASPFTARGQRVTYEIAPGNAYAHVRFRILTATPTAGVVVGDASSTGWTGIEFALGDLLLRSCSDTFPVPTCNDRRPGGTAGGRAAGALGGACLPVVV